MVLLQYGFSPVTAEKCTQGCWTFAAKNCMDHATLSKAGTTLGGASRRCFSIPFGTSGGQPGSLVIVLTFNSVLKSTVNFWRDFFSVQRCPICDHPLVVPLSVACTSQMAAAICSL